MLLLLLFPYGMVQYWYGTFTVVLYSYSTTCSLLLGYKATTCTRLLATGKSEFPTETFWAHNLGATPFEILE